jgi:hypothetical protein
VAYSITLFVRTSEPVAHRAAQQLVNEIVQRDPAVTATADGDGVGWISYDLTTDRDLRIDQDDLIGDLLSRDPASGSVSMEVNTRPDLVKSQIEWGLRNGGPPSLTDCDGLIEITLVGDLIDWNLVELVCDVVRERWHAIMHDEHDGFETASDDSQ